MTTEERYKLNKETKVHAICICPVCERHFEKSMWAQAFCCPACKESYWNSKGDRHKDKKYYRKYNLAHPERIERIIK